MFQPLSGTGPSLGFITNVTSYLSPPHHFNCFMDLSLSPSVSLLPNHPPPLDLDSPLFFHLLLPPLPVLDFLSTWTSVHSHRPPLPVPSLAVLPPLTYYPGSCRPLRPRAVSLFLIPLPLSSRPLFAALNISSIPVDPCGCYLLGSVLLHPVLEPLLSPAGLDLHPVPCRSWGRLDRGRGIRNRLTARGRRGRQEPG